MRYPLRVRSYALVAALALCAACGPSSRRSVRDPAPQMTFDDLCGLQEYFDERRANTLAAPKPLDEVMTTNDKGVTMGEGTYRLADALVRKRFARLLREEYSGVDAKIVKAVASSEGDVSVRVRWWDTGKIRRLRIDGDVILTTTAGTLELPANMCVSDLLFGDQIYEMRARYLRNEVDMATAKTPPALPEPSASAAAPPSASAPAPAASAP